MFRCIGLVSLLSLLSLLAACDGGLRPPPEPPAIAPTTISGTITYVGGRAAWLRADSVVTVRIAAFKSQPSTAGIISAVLTRDAYFSPEALSLDSSLAKFADSTRYTLRVSDPVPPEVRYIAVVVLVDSAARNNQAVLFSAQAWRIVGVYAPSGDQTRPAPLPLTAGTDHRANIRVDFRNPPPQPQ